MMLRRLRCLLFGHEWVPVDEMPDPEAVRDVFKRKGWIWFCRVCGGFHRRFSEGPNG